MALGGYPTKLFEDRFKVFSVVIDASADGIVPLFGYVVEYLISLESTQSPPNTTKLA